jgi:hypothetical protein
MNPSFERLQDSLRAAGVISGDAPMPPDNEQDRPWFIALLQGFAGWLAGIFLLVFLGFVFRPDEQASILLLGAILLVAAYLIYRLDREAVFLDQFALALSIAGQFAVAWGFIGDHFNGLSASMALVVLQVVIWLVMPNTTARTLAALFACIAWVFTIRFMLRPADGFDELVGFGRNSDRLPGAWTLPVGWVLTWGPLIAAVWWLIAREARWMAQGFSERLRPALTGLLAALALAGIAAEPFAFLFLGMDQMGFSFSWWAVFPLLSIALAAFAAYGAFRVRSAGLLGLAIVAGLLHLARFYYFYGTTLLWKSVLMLIAGAGLLALGVWMRSRDQRGETS